MTTPEKIPTVQLNNRLRWLTIISIIETLAALIILFSIPPDPKNALLFGYSWKRWIIYLTTFFIFILLAVSDFKTAEAPESNPVGDQSGKNSSQTGNQRLVISADFMVIGLASTGKIG